MLPIFTAIEQWKSNDNTWCCTYLEVQFRSYTIYNFHLRISNKPIRIAQFISQLRFSTWSSHSLNILIHKMVSFNHIYYRCCNKVLLLLRVFTLCLVLSAQRWVYICVRESWSSKFIPVASICSMNQQQNSFIAYIHRHCRIAYTYKYYFVGIDSIIGRIFYIQCLMALLTKKRPLNWNFRLKLRMPNRVFQISSNKWVRSNLKRKHFFMQNAIQRKYLLHNNSL